VLIILEGSDLAGKTTLCERLRLYLSSKYPTHTTTVLHRGAPSSDPIAEYVDPLRGYEPESGQHIICDRWHIGEIVYPLVLHRPSEMDPTMFSQVEHFLDAKGAFLVHVWVPDSDLIARYKERGDAHRSLHEVLFASEVFKRMMRRSRLPSMTGLHHTPDDIVWAAAGAEVRAAEREKRLPSWE
jgi:thymidylate kinase